MNNNKPLLVANLKANCTWEQVQAWLDLVGPAARNFKGTIIFCPSYPFLATASQKIKSENLPIILGAQDVSEFEQGAYTGEVAASQISSLVNYSIIGHSERRENFNEDEIALAKKVQNATAAKIIPVFCVQGADTEIPEGVQIVAYEPIFAIGTGNAETPENVRKMVEIIKAKGDYEVLYGGSVSAENIQSFIDQGKTDGVLVGATNSVDPQKFKSILSAVK